MDRTEEDRIVERLAAEYSGRMAGSRGESGAHETLQRMVYAGASRFGYRADRRDDAGFDACSLAAPLARMIDHTALKPETTEDEIRMLCQEATKYCFASVCVNPCHVRLVADELRGTAVEVCTVVGFPFGANRTATKRLEAGLAIDDGATEIDMVMNVGYLRSSRYDEVESDIRGVVEEATAHSRGGRRGVIVKVILETALLTDEEKVIACVLAQNAGANFVKTSTGFSSGGATAQDVALMRRVVGESMGVKASGGVRSKEDAESMIAHGASRIGASASVQIVKGSVGSQP